MIFKLPQMGRFPLARISKLIAMAAGEQSPGTVQIVDTATAVHALCSNRTNKPGPLSPEPARCPCDGDPLYGIAPIMVA